jgi:hypothetical protein
MSFHNYRMHKKPHHTEPAWKGEIQLQGRDQGQNFVQELFGEAPRKWNLHEEFADDADFRCEAVVEQ